MLVYLGKYRIFIISATILQLHSFTLNVSYCLRGTANNIHDNRHGYKIVWIAIKC